MATPRTLATAAGACFLATHVTSIGGLILYGPLLKTADYVTGAGTDSRILLGALLEVLLTLSVVGTAVTLHPVTRRRHEALATGYVALRTLEAAVIAVGIVSLLAVVTLRRKPPTGADPGALLTTGKALAAVHDWTFLLGPNFICGANTALLALLLYRSRLVPRPIAVLGLAGGALIFASAIAVLFGAYEQVSGPGMLAAVPVFAWELCLAVRLLTKGFTPTATATA
ncbi:hypothetical protein GCM10018790_04830 [Kitasatospora xanthocidica]|uniref:DUF4386 domain-containing protein n=1 Tax=Kitasatospora xanthocidica TaxID=83382 RepID=UPI001679F214|nr:DUF4386 domain-containing protein [Kitasatospora xanthocidica]GHF30297.1 hypothetical protein GCM10018790_04830 [Kitasatospora xanthocidica]